MAANASSDTPVLSRRHVHILIVGAGLTGLIFAQGLRKFNASPAATAHPTKYTYSLFERDPYALSRGGGYSLSIHWALSNLRDALPEDTLIGLNDCLVNPYAFEQGEPGQFQYLNFRTGEQVVAFPFRPGSSARVSREKIIKLLMTGLDIQFSKHLSDISYPTDTAVKAHFADGTSAIGDLLIGADGVRSKVRRDLCPGPKGQTRQLPVRMLGVKVSYPVEKVEQCRKIDPHFYHGGDPQTNVYSWFSFIHLPRPTDGIPDAECQLTFSWPYEKGFLGREEPTDMPATNAERHAWMRQLADGWAEPFREMIYDLPEGTELREIGVEDWRPEKGAWDNHNGRVTLVGDAAHAMTIFRGEAANHGIVDVTSLMSLLLGKQEDSPKAVDLKHVVDTYEYEMIERTYPATLRAHQACLDANHFASVKDGSPLIARRAIKVET